MIRQIRGKVLSVGITSAVIDVAGFGIQVYMVAPQILTIDKEATLATHLAIKQDGADLYGFLTADDRNFFELIISVSGIGPKTALGVMRRAPREALEGAISKRDLAYLTKVVGLGRKSAEKMLVELAEKIGPHSHDSADNEVFDTLVALGYTEREARKTLQSIPDSIIGKEKRLKAALSSNS
jgi:Holliday junction DNA helicase RuvA